MAWAAVIGAGGAIAGGVIASKGAKSAAQTASQAGQLDPRIANIVFGSSNGSGPQQGLLAQYQALGQQPQSAASQAWANTNADYLTQHGGSDLGQIRNTAQGLMQGNAAPNVGVPLSNAAQTGTAQASVPSYAVGNMVDAPSQNNINLSPTFQSLLSGGDTTKLTDSLKAGNALAGAQFQQNQSDLTDNLQRNILPGVRGGAIAAGQYGSSRQGIAEGLAVSDLTKQLNNSNTQFGLGATAANSAALANNYENGQTRALSAAQGLSAQQYGVAQQNANTKNQAEFMNVGNQLDISKYNAGLAQQSNLANAGFNQQTNLANQNAQSQGALAGLQAQLTTNGQNNSAAGAGAGLLAGLLGQTGANVGAQDNYAINKAGQVNGLLQPYLSGVPTQSGVSSNSTAAGLGGALQGLQFGNQLSGLLGGSNGGSSLYGLSGTSGISGYSPASTMPVNTSLFSNYSF